MTGEAVSLVCVDEHELLRAIERFTKSSIKKVEIEAFKPDPSIAAEPIQNGRGGGQKRGGGGNRNNRSSTNAGNRKKKPSKNKPANTKPENDRTPTEKKKKPRNPHAEKIGSNLQEKLDKLDKRDHRQNKNNNRRR